jgi:hypothetical protein
MGSAQAKAHVRKCHEETISAIWDMMYDMMWEITTKEQPFFPMRSIAFSRRRTYRHADGYSKTYDYSRIKFGEFYTIEADNDYRYMFEGKDAVWMYVRADEEKVIIWFETERRHLAKMMTNLMCDADR